MRKLCLTKELSKANNRLKEALDLEPAQMLRDTAIQRFTLSFKLAWKAIQSYILEQRLECRSPINCFRIAA